jgi:16S rRNA (uracil1498-N3)-methyltransferase
MFFDRPWKMSARRSRAKRQHTSEVELPGLSLAVWSEASLVSYRFYVPDVRAVGDTVALPADEAEHAARVLRLKAGAPVGVFDGRGGEYTGVIVSASKSVTVHIAGLATAAAEPEVSVTLVHAVLKGDKMDEVVRDAVMIGVAAIRPIVTTRSETSLGALRRGGRVERWRRVAVASAKQCGRAVVPDVQEVCALQPAAQWLDTGGIPPPRLLLVEPSVGAGQTVKAADVPRPAGQAVALVVGPEGGWTPEEVAGLSEACVRVGLGPRTLRADRAALVAVASLFAVWGSESRPKAQGLRPKTEGT